MTSVAGIVALVALTAVGADEVKPIDGGKGSGVQSKSFEIKGKGDQWQAGSFGLLGLCRQRGWAGQPDFVKKIDAASHRF